MDATGKGAVKKLMLRALLTAALLAAAMAVLAFALGKSGVVISIAAGAVMAMASFAVLAAVVVRAIPVACGPEAFRRQPLAVIATVGCLKLAFLGAALWVLISRDLVYPLPFMAGFSTMVAALLVEGLRLKGTAQTSR